MRFSRPRVLALLLVVVLVFLVVRSNRGASPLTAPAASIDGYSVVYRIEVRAQGTEISRREIQVKRPSHSRDMNYAENATTPVSGFVSSGTQLFGLNGESTLNYGDRVASVAPGDYRLLPLLGDLQRLDLARKITTKRVADRPCTVYRFGAPLGDPIKAQAPGEYTDLCIDQEGLILLERWFLKDKLLRETKAVSVELITVPSDDAFAPPDGELKPNPSGVGMVKKLSTKQLPDTGLPYWTAPKPLWGFELTARARAITTSSTSGSPQVTDILYVDSYTRGHDTIEVLHRELSASGPLSPGAERVKAGDLGSGEVGFTSSGASISSKQVNGS